MDRLLREANPPTGQLASPKPQYKKPGEDAYEPVEGQYGAPFAILKNASGQVISPATEEKLEQARVLLNTISTKDFATQTTLAAVLAKLEQLETEIQAVKANQVSGDQKVTLSGTKVVESAPVTGIKTVTSTVAEVFAGSSRKANRSKLVIRNLHQAVAIRIGGSGITDTIGQSLEPGASVEIDFSPSTTVPIYAVSTAGNVSVEVLEV